MDDLDLDEHGIFREKAGGSNGSEDQGILVDVDEDGIWRDDRDELSHYTDPLSHYRQSDSGISTDKKSSNATLNQVKSDFGSEEENHQVVPSYGGDLFSDDNGVIYGRTVGNVPIHGDSGSQIDSKSTTSYHISELEASESVQGDVSFEQDSDQPLEFPELVDDSYLLSDQSNNQRNQSSGNQSEEQSVDLDQYIDPQQYSEDSLFKSHRPFALDPEVIGYDDNDDKDENDRYSSSEGEVSDIGEEYDDFNDMMVTRKESKEQHHRESHPLITGDSIFTQEEFSHKHSLHEFEKLEAALDDSGSENGEKLDLIGAYLRGLKDQEDDDLNDQEVASHDPSDKEQRHRPPVRHHSSKSSKIPVRSPTRSMSRNSDRAPSRSMSRSPTRPVSKSPSRIPSYRGGSPSLNRPHSHGPTPGRMASPMGRIGSPSRIPRRSPVRAIHSPGISSNRRQSFSPRSPRVFDTLENGYQKTRDTISMISGSVDEIMLEPGNSEDESEYDRHRELREGEPGLGETATSFAFDTSLIMDQKFPFVDDPYSSLHFSDDQPGSRGESPRRSKIPMLRSRSPSMSRPGSSLSRSNSCGPGSRSQSPSRKLVVGPNQTGIPAPIQSALKRRSLPLTPQKRKPGEVQEDISKTVKSHEVLISSSPPQDIVPPMSARSVTTTDYQLSQPESELGRATNLLIMDAEEMEAKDTVTSLRKSHGNRQRTHSPTGKQRDRSPTGKLRSISPDYSGGEDLSQGSVTSKTELKTRYVQEIHERKRHEETLNHLSEEYSTLLKKYAEAENTIDELRLGAKVRLYSDSPTPAQAQPGVVGYQPGVSMGAVPGQAMSSLSMSGVVQAGIAGTIPGVSGQPSTAQQGHQASSQSSSAGSTRTPSIHPSLSRDELDSLAGEGVKLSLLAKSKAIEEQVNAFQILLKENHLNLDDQTQALDNIKSNYDNLQTDYSTAKEEHEYIRRQGALSEAALDPGFDENQEVAGEIFRLNMKLDQIEHNVAENKKKQVVRKPFSGKPVKGDHSLVKQGNESSLPADRTASTGSMAGVGSIDDKLHKLSKDYNALMDRYRRLKGLKRSPQTDNEISEVLENIKAVYKQTPDHRKPALPAELDRLYDPQKGEFLSPEEIDDQEEETVSPRSVFSETRKTSADRITSHQGESLRRGRSSSLESEPSTEYTDKTPARERYSRGRSGQPNKSSDLQNEKLRDQYNRRDKYSPRDQKQQSSLDRYLERSGSGTIAEREGRRLPRPGPGPRRKDGLWAGHGIKNDRAWKKDKLGGDKNTPWRKDGREEKDSGYMGSEGSRKAVAGAGSRGLPKRGVSGGTGTSFDRPHDMEDRDSDIGSSSDSADSVIERKISRSRPPTTRNAEHSDELNAPKGGQRGDNRGQIRSRSRSQGRSVADSESSVTSAEKSSPRSEKLKSLTDEVERLKATLNPNQVLIQGQPHQIVSGIQAGVPPVMQQGGVNPMQPNNNAMNYINPGLTSNTTGQPFVAGQPTVLMGQPGVMGQPTGYANSAYTPYTEYPHTGYEYYDGYNQAPPIDNKENYYRPEYGDEYVDGYSSPGYYRSHDRQSHDPYYGSGDIDGYNSYGDRDNYNSSKDPYRRDSYSRGRDYSKNRDPYSRDRRDRSDPYYEAEDYESRDPYKDFDDRDYNDNRRPDSLEGDHHDYRSRLSGDRHGGRRHGHHRSKSREKSPDIYSEMRRHYVPRRRDFSGSPERRTHYSPAGYSSGTRNPPPPSRGINGRPPPYPAANRTPHYRPMNHMAPPSAVNNNIVPPPSALNNTSYTPTAAYVPMTPGLNSGVPNQISSSITTPSAYVPNNNAQAGYTQYTNTTPTCCPMCGGQGQHSHSNYVFQPNASQSTGSGLVPVQLVPSSSQQKGDPKVRYYVREYGGDSNVQLARNKTYKGISDSEDEDLNDSLHKAMQTAKKLKKMSVRMKQSLHDEINRSIQESSFLMT